MKNILANKNINVENLAIEFSFFERDVMLEMLKNKISSLKKIYEISEEKIHVLSAIMLLENLEAKLKK